MHSERYVEQPGEGITGYGENERERERERQREREREGQQRAKDNKWI